MLEEEKQNICFMKASFSDLANHCPSPCTSLANQQSYLLAITEKFIGNAECKQQCCKHVVPYRKLLI